MNLISLRLRNPQTMSERFAWIMDALFCAIWEQSTRFPDWFVDKALRRIRRFGNHVNRVLAALQAGTYRAPKPRGPRKPSIPPEAATPNARASRARPRPPNRRAKNPRSSRSTNTGCAPAPSSASASDASAKNQINGSRTLVRSFFTKSK